MQDPNAFTNNLIHSINKGGSGSSGYSTVPTVSTAASAVSAGSSWLSYLPAILPMLTSIFGAVAGGQSSPSADKAMEMYNLINSKLDTLGAPALTKDQVFNEMLPHIQKSIRNFTDTSMAHAGIGAVRKGNASGTPQGQDMTSYYISEQMPAIAEGEKAQMESEKFANQLWAQMDAESKDRMLKGLSLMLGTTSEMQKGSTSENVLAGGLFGAKAGSDVGMGLQALLTLI